MEHPTLYTYTKIFRILFLIVNANAIDKKSNGNKSTNRRFPNAPPPKGCDQLEKIIVFIANIKKLTQKRGLLNLIALKEPNKASKRIGLQGSKPWGLNENKIFGII
jgi:hypothetical protein